MYAKIISGYLISSTENFLAREDYIAAGYKPVVFVPRPEKTSENDYMVGWEEQDDAIIQTWESIPLPDDISEAEAFDILMGEK